MPRTEASPPLARDDAPEAAPAGAGPPAGARVLLLSTYEQGHQPLGLAAPAAALRARGHRVDAIDLAVEPLDEERVREADLVALSVPMHTASRLALALAPRLRALRPEAPIALYGLYAGLLGGLREDGVVDAVAGGDYEPALRALADRAASRGGEDPPAGGEDGGAFGRRRHPAPDRVGLPPLARYARLETADGLALAGYVEASRGCAHRCLHCPVTAAWGGRLRLVDADAVLADAAAQVALGAAHLTFGDPDFLNAVPHSLAVAEALHARWPALTFDVTAKVEHLREHAPLLPRLRELGCLFVTSAFESTSDEVLRQLDKGHAAADLVPALDACTRAGLALRPTWMTFTPWTRAEDVAAQFAFVEAHGLAARVPAVQYGLRLLVPPGSPLIGPLREQGLLGGYDGEALTWRWRALDSRTVALQRDLAALAAEGHDAEGHDAGGDGAGGDAYARLFARMRDAAFAAAGRSLPDGAPPRRLPAAPGLTESWFC